jgi:pre-60S factor REI1
MEAETEAKTRASVVSSDGNGFAFSASSFTCTSCRARFENAEEQRTHYRSDWHRYNLRRKAASLPPLAFGAYSAKLANLRDQNDQAAEEAANAATRRECVPCRRVFASAAAHDNHLKSRRHIEALAKATASSGPSIRLLPQHKGTETTSSASPLNTLASTALARFESLGETASDEQVQEAMNAVLESSADRLGPHDCLYCIQGKDCGSIENLLAHMHTKHSFYIPDLDSLQDLPGLLRYLADKVAVWHVCLTCGGPSRQPFASLAACRAHMLDKGHTGIRYDDDGSSELASFYDYSSLRLHSSRAEGDNDNDDDDDDEYTTTDNDEEYTVIDEDNDALILAPDESELILPNGRRLGSRAYRHYYRQNLMPYLPGLEVSERPNVLRPINAPRPDGTVVRGQHFVPPPPAPLTVQQKRDRRIEHDSLRNFALRIGMNANGLQKHFREQYMQ